MNKIVYCELTDETATKLNLPKYVTWMSDGDIWQNIKLVYGSDRVWTEDESCVRFIKHRNAGTSDTVVDVKEFNDVKLKSVNV